MKLHSALWAYHTSYKTSIQSTPFQLAFGLEAVMPIEFHVPNLCIQGCKRLSEGKSKQTRWQQLVELGEARAHNMVILEHK